MKPLLYPLSYRGLFETAEPRASRAVTQLGESGRCERDLADR